VERAWEILGFALCASIVILIITALTVEHKVQRYYLNGDNAVPHMMIEIDWQKDEVIKMPPSITFEEATGLVNRLNAGLDYER